MAVSACRKQKYTHLCNTNFESLYNVFCLFQLIIVFICLSRWQAFLALLSCQFNVYIGRPVMCSSFVNVILKTPTIADSIFINTKYSKTSWGGEYGLSAGTRNYSPLFVPVAPDAARTARRNTAAAVAAVREVSHTLAPVKTRCSTSPTAVDSVRCHTSSEIVGRSEGFPARPSAENNCLKFYAALAAAAASPVSVSEVKITSAF